MTATKKAIPVGHTILKPQPTHDSLAQRVTDLRGRIDQQTQARAAATLDGGIFDAAQLTAAEAELAAVTDAQGELTRRDRADQDAKAAAERTERQERVRALAAAWLGHIDDAEAAARAMTEANKLAETARLELQALLHGLNGSTPPMMMSQEQEMRRSQALAAVIHMTVGKSHFGEMPLMSGAWLPDAPWAGAERALVETLTSKWKTSQ